MTQQQVGDRIGNGVDKGTVSRWENVKRVPSINVIAAYAEAINVPIANLFLAPGADKELEGAIANAPKKLQKMVAEVARVILKTGT